MNKVEFDRVWNSEIKPPNETGGNDDSPIDIVFVIDYSYSMTWNDPEFLRKKVTNEFVSKLRDDKDRAAIVKFISFPTVLCDLTSNKQQIIDSVNSIVDNNGYGTGAGTNGSAGINSALSILKTSTAKNRYIVFLTDGEDTSVSYSYDSLINQAKEAGIAIYSIGLGSANKNLLANIANGTGGKYYFASVATDLPDIYNEVSFETVDYVTDSNNDGISDYYTKLLCDGDMVLSTGSKILMTTDLNYNINGVLSDDFDGDGLTNGEELKITQNGNRIYVEMLSNPLDKDTDGDGYSDYNEVKNMKTSPLKYTKNSISSLNYLIDHNNYNYFDFAHDKNIIRNGVTFLFDWQKTKESKANIINYFYDYASEESINDNADAIARLTAKQKFWEVFETFVDITSTLKNVVDAGTKAASDTKAVEKLTKDCTDAKIKALKEHNEKSFKDKTGKDIDILSKQIGIVTAAESTITDLADAITELGFGDIVGTAKTITGLVSKSFSLAKKCNKSWTLPLGKSISKFANSYQAWMGNTDKLGISNGAKIGIAFDVVDLAVETANLNNTYGKIMANTQAFEDYIDVIDYISSHGNDKDYIKKAASELMSILLDTSWDTYYRKLNAAIAKEAGKTLLNAAISIAGDFCPYIKAAELVKDIAVTTFSLLGYTSYSQSVVSLQMIDAISDGCIYLISKKVSFAGLYFTYESDDSCIYIIQLAQSRIVGEKILCDYLKKNNATNLLRKVIHGQSNNDYDSITSDNIDYIYTMADNIELVLSPNLPKYSNGKWVTLASTSSGGGGGAW